MSCQTPLLELSTGKQKKQRPGQEEKDRKQQSRQTYQQVGQVQEYWVVCPLEWRVWESLGKVTLAVTFSCFPLLPQVRACSSAH